MKYIGTLRGLCLPITAATLLLAGCANTSAAPQTAAAEKHLFPESSTYMDFLMKKPKQQ